MYLNTSLNITEIQYLGMYFSLMIIKKHL